MSRIGSAAPLGATHLAFSWLTVLPLPQPAGAIDRRAGSAAITAVPLVGVFLGAVVATLGFGLIHTHLPVAVCGALCIATLALLTRGMHIDGLCDTADGLGCYGPPERVREVMHSGPAGPFGVATLVLVLTTQASGVGELLDRGDWLPIVFAATLGRFAAVLACRRGLGPAPATGFGALVTDSQRMSIVVWFAVIAAAAGGLGATGGNGFDVAICYRALGALLAVTAFTWLLTRHCARRMGAINGDVLGASIEVGTLIAILALLV